MGKGARRGGGKVRVGSTNPPIDGDEIGPPPVPRRRPIESDPSKLGPMGRRAEMAKARGNPGYTLNDLGHEKRSNMQMSPK